MRFHRIRQRATAALAAAGLAAALPAAALAAPPPVHIVRNVVLAPGGQAAIALPVLAGFPNAPVHVLVSFTAANKGQLQPSSVLQAVVAADPVAQTITWIGTNNDGSATSGNTLPRAGAPPPVVANFFCNAAPCWIGRLTAGPRGLILEQNAATSSVPGHYVVTLWQ